MAKKKLQNPSSTNTLPTSVKYSPTSGIYYLAIHINVNANKEGYPKSIIDFGIYGEIEINARVDDPLPIGFSVLGTIGSNELFLDGEKILYNSEQPIRLILTLKSSKE